MKFTYSMLGHYLKGAFTLDDVVSGLIDIGLEVESVTNEAERLKDFILAEIKDTRRHPEADRLQICTVDTGSQVIELVCGGKNARPGIKVILAPVGAIIPSTGQVLKAGKVRGVDSPGMLCSSDELVIDIPCDGILEVVADLPLGTNAAIALGLNDPVIDVSITPNRSDCFSVLGIARDLYAYFSIQNRAVTFKPFEVSPHVGRFDCPIRVTNNAPEACYAFGLTLVKNVRNNPSPSTMSSCLRALGLRPISTLVDITNYM
ncbi:MAG: phenylalanine--tRNA ligase subunit beta, partial [Alphaproteobacteria bacterium]|nr:phenylalanine--tRNA ligase subunit beta [Alphaproteobacteria bacterium]